MLYDKQLVGNSDDLSTQTIFNYKVYDYSQKDYLETYKKYCITTLNTSSKVQLKNGIFFINDLEVFTVGSKSIKEVLEQLEVNGVEVEWYSDQFGTKTYEQVLEELPGALLVDFSNYASKGEDAEMSPHTIKPIYNKSIETLTSTQTTIILSEDGDKVPYVKKGSLIYYEVVKGLKIVTSEISTHFRLYVDLSPRRFTDKETVSYLLNYKKD